MNPVKESKFIIFQIQAPEKEKLKAYCKLKGMSYSEACRRALKQFLKSK